MIVADATPATADTGEVVNTSFVAAASVGLTVKVAPPVPLEVQVPSVTLITLEDSDLCATKVTLPAPALSETFAAVFCATPLMVATELSAPADNVCPPGPLNVRLFVPV